METEPVRLTTLAALSDGAGKIWARHTTGASAAISTAITTAQFTRLSMNETFALETQQYAALGRNLSLSPKLLEQTGIRKIRDAQMTENKYSFCEIAGVFRALSG